MKGLTILAAAAALTMAGAAAANPVSDWMAVADGYAREARRTAGMETPRAAPAWYGVQSRVAAAMFEAANAADRRFTPYFGVRAASGPASVEAAVVVAAHDVLAALFPDRKDALANMLALELAKVPDGPMEDEGAALGREAAKAALDRRLFEGAGPFPAYVPPTSAGRYVATTDPGHVGWLFGYKPWLLPSLTAVVPAPPPPLDGEAYRASVEETRLYGGRQSERRTPVQTATAKFWFDGVSFAPTLRAVAARPGRRLVETARLNALLELATMDTSIAVDTQKMTILRWRPITAIRLGGNDDDPATTGDPAWEPLLRTPGNSEYPCGHCTVAANSAALMEAELGPVTPEATFRSETLGGTSVTGMRWADYPPLVSNSRIWAGAHFRSSAGPSEAYGRALARIQRASFATPLPAKRPSGNEAR